MQTYISYAGQKIDDVAKEMVEMANLTGDRVRTTFSLYYIEIIAKPHKNVATGVSIIIDFYNSELARQEEGHRNSPEGRQAAIIAEKLRNHLQNQVAQAMVDLAKLDFSDLNAIIGWLEKIEKTAHMDVVLPSKEILKKFEFHGFEFNVNYGEKSHNIKNVDNFARQIISFALGQIRDHGSIHQSFPRFVERWREKFEYTTT
ncbi:MAG: hypothetical protein ACD_19C00346G0003 [uncultured bacterium]|nr:MAG: hypothetical protein ACD_19C00346G0003 [uncultured bacterium]